MSQSPFTFFSYGENHKIIGKTDPQNLSYEGAWEVASGNFSSLAKHIGAGHPWMPALLDGNGKRWQSNANHAEILGADIDKGLTIEQALQHPFIVAHCGLAIESSSSSPEVNKFRLVFRLPEALTDWQTIRICNSYLIRALGVADRSCKDASRFFFGAQGREALILNEEARLPDSFIQDAIAWQEQLDAEAEAESLAAIERAKAFAPVNSDEQLRQVELALSFIPPREEGTGNYADCFAVLCALYHAYGESQSIAIAETWSPSQAGKDWNIPRKIRSIKNTPTRTCGLGTIFHLAKQNGFKFPKQPIDRMVLDAKAASRAYGDIESKPDLKVMRGGKIDQHTPEEIGTLIDSAIENNASGSQMTIFLKNLQKNNPSWTLADLDRIRSEKASESDSIAEVDAALKGLSQALKSDTSIYDPRKEYPAQLANEIIKHSKAAYIDPIADCLYIDAHVGSSLGSRVVLSVAGRYVAAPDYFALVARSGTGKTEAKNATTKPLEDIGRIERDRYISERKEYDAAQKLHDKEGGTPPEEPAPCRKYIHKRGSAESLTKRLSELPNGAGLSWVRDELAGLFASLNRFKDSDFRQQLIEMWDGGTDEDDRVDAANAMYIKDIAMSIVGNFQPRIAFDTFKDPYDADGLRARFNLRLMKDVEPNFDVEPEEDISKGLRDCLSSLYAYLRVFDTNGTNEDNKYVVRMSNAAKEEYKRFQKKNYADRVAVEQETSEEAFLNKGAAHVSRKILRLHCTECFFNAGKDRNLVTSETVQRAVSWWNDCVRDFRILAGMSGAEDRLDKILLKIQEHALKAGEAGVTLRDLYGSGGIRAIKSAWEAEKKNNRTAQISEVATRFVDRLVEAGLGRMEPRNRTKVYIAFENWKEILNGVLPTIPVDVLLPSPATAEPEPDGFDVDIEGLELQEYSEENKPQIGDDVAVVRSRNGSDPATYFGKLEAIPDKRNGSSFYSVLSELDGDQKTVYVWNVADLRKVQCNPIAAETA